MNRKSLLIGLVLAGALALGGGLLLRNLARSQVQHHKLEATADFDIGGERGTASEPRQLGELRFPEFPQPELLWIIGCRSELFTAGGTPAPLELGIESNVSFDAARHAQIFEEPIYGSDLLFALPGGTTDLSFPDGFGLPFYSDEVLRWAWELLEDYPGDEAESLRQHVTIEYLLDRDLNEPMKPLFVTSALVGDVLDGRDTGVPPDDADSQAARRLVNPPYATRLHLVAGPAGLRAGSIELRDAETGETIFPSSSHAFDPETGDVLVSEEGVRLDRGRDYEWVRGPDDVSKIEPGSRTVVQLYLRDKLFRKRTRHLASVRHVDEPVPIGNERLMLQTNHGEIQIGLYPEVAPRHVEQIIKLARLGVYDGVPFHRIEPGFLIQLGFPEGRLGPPLNAEQRAALKPLKAEITDLPQRRWTVSMALHNNADPDSAEASFFILFDEVRRLDQRFTIVGRVVGGLGTLHSIAKVPLDGSVPLEPVLIEEATVMTREQILATRESN